MAKERNPRLIVGPFVGHFVRVFEPEENRLGGEPKYSLTMVFPNEESVAALKQAAKTVAVAKWGATLPAKMSSPFHSSDAATANGSVPATDWGFGKGTVYIKARSKFKPGLAKLEGENVVELINPGELYGGCTCKAEVSMFAYDTAGNKGVSCQLENVLKIADGEGEFARKSAVSVFGGTDAPAETASEPTGDDPFDV